MLDIKKCGHSFPKTLMLWMRDVLIEYFPQYDWNLITDLLNTTVDYGKKDTAINERGYYLGWLDEFATLGQCTLLTVLNNRRDHLIKKACFFNDDSIIGVKLPKIEVGLKRQEWSHSTYQYIHDELVDICETWSEFGIILNTKYTCAGSESVFCEVYSDPTWKGLSIDKSSYIAAGTLARMKHVPIAFAKEMLKSSCGVFNSNEKCKEILNEVIRYKGYEFHPCEVKIPVRLGGWKVVDDIDGLNHDLVEVEKLGPLEWYLIQMIQKIKVENPHQYHNSVARTLPKLRTEQLNSWFTRRGTKEFSDIERIKFAEIHEEVSKLSYFEESYYLRTDETPPQVDDHG